MLFAAYFDIETTTATCSAFNPEDWCLVSFAIIFAFHPRLDIDRITTEKIFSHPLEKLTDISYLTADMLESYDPITAEQLRNAAINVSRKKTSLQFW